MIRQYFVSLAIRWPRALSWLHQIGAVLTVWAVICLVGALAGCSLAPNGSQAQALLNQAHETSAADIQNFNDGVRDTTIELTCLPSIGSVGRMTDKVRQFYILQACGIDATPPKAPAVLASP